MPSTIRTYCSDDAETVRKLWNECLVVDQPWNAPEQAISRQQAIQPEGFFVGRIDGTVIATCVAGYDGVRGWLYRVVVSPEHRGQGYGRQIVEHAERYLQSLGCVRINLQVLGSNADAVEFWRRNDYIVQDRISMAKVLEVPSSRSASPTSDSAPPRVDLPSQSADGTIDLPLKGRSSKDRSAPPLEHDPTPTMEIGGGVRLTRFQTTDKSQLRRILNESEIYSRYTSLPFPYLASHADEWVTKWVSPTPQTSATERVWAIRDRDATLIGAVGLHDIQSAHDAEIGYWLTTVHWGQGIATLAVDRVCNFAFEKLSLTRTTAKVVAENTASIRVLEKNDFQREGTLRRAHKRGNEETDVHLFGRLSPNLVDSARP